MKFLLRGNKIVILNAIEQLMYVPATQIRFYDQFQTVKFDELFTARGPPKGAFKLQRTGL